MCMVLREYVLLPIYQSITDRVASFLRNFITAQIQEYMATDS